MSAESIENMVLMQLFTLVDPQTNGMMRYHKDSYLRQNGYTNSAQWVIGGIKRKIAHDAQTARREADLDHKQELRDKLTPGGKPAAWTHPLSQVGSWAASRYATLQQAGKPEQAVEYLQLATYFLNTALSLVTGKKQVNVVRNRDGLHQVAPVPEGEMPECWIAFELPSGEHLHVPSPHSPLNWSSAMLKELIGILRLSPEPDATATARMQAVGATHPNPLN